MSNKLDITIEQGSDFRRVLTITDQGGTPIDLTGYTFRGQGRKNYQDALPAFTFTFLITGVGTVSWTLTNDALTSLSLSYDEKFRYDVEMVSSGGIVKRIISGFATVSPEVTK